MPKIRKDDIFDPALFAGTAAEIQQLIDVTKVLQKELLEVMKISQKALKGNKISSASDIRAQSAAIRKVQEAEKGLTAAQKERVKLEQKLSNMRKKGAAENAQLNLQVQEQRRLLKEQARETTKALGAYTNLSARLNRLRREYKDLAASEKQNTAEAKALLKEISALDTKLKGIDSNVGQFQRNVGNYTGAINKLKGGFQGIARLAGVGLGLAGLNRLFTSSFNIVREFDDAMGNLAAVTGKTRGELSELEQTARDLGASTEFTAGQVAGLQTELAKLGFSVEEIQDSTGVILDFATATGADLPSAAALAGNALRAFGLDSSQMERVVATLGVSTSKSALDFEKLNSSLATVAPVAASFGFSVEDTTALLGQLANAGFDASSAATATKNILLNLADANGDLAQALGRPITSADDLAAGLQQLQADGIDLAEALELTDRRSVAAFSTFLENSDTLVEFRDSITGVEGELQTMAATQRDTLGGAVKRLQSAWEGLILDIAEGGSEFISLKDIINFLADNLVDIIKIIVTATSAFAGFKAGLLIHKIVTNLTKGFKALRGGIGGALKAFKALNTAAKANVIGALVGTITAVVTALNLWGNTSERVKSVQEKLNEAIDEGIGKVEAEMQAVERSLAVANDKALTDEQRQKALDELKDSYPEYLGFLELETLNTNEAREAINALNTALQLKAKINATVAVQEEDQVRLAKLRRALARGSAKDLILLIHGEEAYNKVRGDGINVGIRQQLADQARAEAQAEFLKLSAEQNILQQELIGFQKELGLLEEENANRSKKNADDKNQSSERTVAQIKEEIKALEDQKDALSGVGAGIPIQKKIDELTAEKNAILGVTEAKKGSAKATKEEFDAELALRKLRAQNLEGIEKEIELEKIRALEEKKALTDEFQKARAEAKTNEEKLKLDDQLKAALIELELKHTNNLRKIFIDRNKDLNKITAEELKKGTEDRHKEQEKKEKEQADAMAKVWADAAKERNEEEQKRRDEELKAQIHTVQQAEAAMDILGSKASERIDRQIANIDKLMEKSRARQEELRQLAIQGNIDAEKSLAEEERREQELEVKKLKAQRRQQLIDAAIAGFKAYGAKVEAGDRTPLQSTVKDLTSLSAFIKSLPTFYEGSEHLGDDLGAPDLAGRDGYIIRADGSERIVDGENNRKLRGISNDELGSMAQMIKSGEIHHMAYSQITAASQRLMDSTWNSNSQIVKKFTSLENAVGKVESAVKNIPQAQWDYDKLSDAVIEKIKKGQNIEIKHHKNGGLFS